jgi:hypothetical protein
VIARLKVSWTESDPPLAVTVTDSVHSRQLREGRRTAPGDEAQFSGDPDQVVEIVRLVALPAIVVNLVGFGGHAEKLREQDKARECLVDRSGRCFARIGHEDGLTPNRDLTRRASLLKAQQAARRAGGEGGIRTQAISG